MSISKVLCHNFILFSLTNSQPYSTYGHTISITPITSFIHPWVYIQPLGYLPSVDEGECPS